MACRRRICSCVLVLLKLDARQSASSASKASHCSQQAPLHLPVLPLISLKLKVCRVFRDSPSLDRICLIITPCWCPRQWSSLLLFSPLQAILFRTFSLSEDAQLCIVLFPVYAQLRSLEHSSGGLHSLFRIGADLVEDAVARTTPGGL